MSIGLTFSPIQKKMIEILCDREHLHPAPQFHACLNDELGEASNIQAHMSNLRKKLQPLGWNICSTRDGGLTYYYLTEYPRHKATVVQPTAVA